MLGLELCKRPSDSWHSRPCPVLAGLKRSRLVQDKSGRIRQGSPEEEQALGLHITALAVAPKQLTEAGQLCELLTLLGGSLPAHLAPPETLPAHSLRIAGQYRPMQSGKTDSRL